MNEQTPAGKDPGTAGQARHGYRNEVNWEGGSGRHWDDDPARGPQPPASRTRVTGRQPYGNQGPEETPSPAATAEYAAGNRAEQSGQNLDQLERVKRKP